MVSEYDPYYFVWSVPKKITLLRSCSQWQLLGSLVVYLVGICNNFALSSEIVCESIFRLIFVFFILFRSFV